MIILPGDQERLQWLLEPFSIDYAIKYIELLGNQQMNAIEHFFPDYFDNQKKKLDKLLITYTERCFIHYQFLMKKFAIELTIAQGYNESKFFKEMTKGFLQSILDLEVCLSLRTAKSGPQDLPA